MHNCSILIKRWIANVPKKQYMCIHCGHGVQDLFKKFSNSVKTATCNKCHKVVDIYIEFEPVIIVVDAVLLSEKSFRHMLYNRNFKLNWKLLLVLLLLESFALWRQKRNIIAKVSPNDDMVHEKGFYCCCLQNILDYLTLTCLLLVVTIFYGGPLVWQREGSKCALTLLKAVAIANFSKFFLLPIMVWRENTTDLGAYIHHLLVLGHHLCSLIFIYAVITGHKKQRAAVLVLPVYFVKEYIRNYVAAYMEQNL